MKAPVLAALLLLNTVSPAVSQDWSLQVPAHKKSIFGLESNEGHCSAILINEKEGYLLTAAHCVPEKVEGRSLAVDQKHAEPVRLNTVLDLAVLKAPEIHGTALSLRKDDAAPGLPIAIVGFGFAATRLKYGFGWVSDVRDDSLRGIGDRLYFSAAGVVPGDSGGAVVDLAGHIVSVVQGSVARGGESTTLNFGPPSNVLEDFLKSYLPKP